MSTVKSADRALVILEYVAQRRAASFTDIADALTLPRSSAHGLLGTLTASGWLALDAGTKMYTLGLRAWQIGQLYEGHRDVVSAAKPVMDELSAELGETVQLARLDGVENVYIAISDSPNPMRLASSVGMRLPSYATGIGKALLGMLSPAEASQRLRTAELRSYTPHTVTDADELLDIIDQTRERHFAVDDEEYVSDCRCVAVPISHSESTGVYTAMSVTMPTYRTTDRWPEDVLEPLQRAADSVRARLGIREP